MGIETSLPDVEESTEPPIRSSIHEGHQQRPGSALNQSTSADRRPDEGEEASKSHGTALPLDLDELQNRQEICEYAYTYSTLEVSHALGVDLQ